MYDLLWILLLVDVAINVAGLFISVIFKTYHHFDLLGSISYLTLTALSLGFSSLSIPQIVQSSCIFAWALRLGYYLFTRAKRRGDKRFDKYETNWWGMTVPFVLQIVWVYVMLLPTLILNELDNPGITVCSYIGWALWLIGFGFEAVSDYQKKQFSMKEENRGRFITKGLWSISRHPNYFGEVLLWTGLFVAVTLNYSEWWQWTIGALSVLFIYSLLRYVSGISMLEKGGLERWGDDPAYQEHLKKTPVFVPLIPIYK